MTRRTGADTKREILQAAAALFHTQGYRGTSLADIAQTIGYSKASVFYHFPTKEALLVELISPAIADFEALLDRLALLPQPQARSAAAEGLADLALRHGDVAAVLNSIGPLLNCDPSLQLFDHQHVYDRFLLLIAGHSPSSEAKVAVEVALAGGTAACVENAGLPPEQLRDALVAVLTRVLALTASP
jgi:AcrR family transcriptional regulator